MINFEVSLFSDSPDDYLLQIKHVNGQKELNIINKSIFTCLRIHLGLLDKKSLSLHEVASYAREVKKELDESFLQALDYKIAIWNHLHPNSPQIPTVKSHRNEFTFSDVSYYHKLLNMSESQITHHFMFKLPPGCFSAVKTHFMEKLDSSFSTGLPAPKGKVCVVEFEALHKAQNLASTLFEQSSIVPNFEKIVNELNMENDDKVQEFKNVDKHKDLQLIFFKDQDEACHVKASVI